MAKKAIFYPNSDADVSSFYDNALKKLTAYGAKYGTTPALLTILTNYNTQVPAAKIKSDADQQAAKASVKAKDELFEKAKTELMREFKRVTDLPNFDEADAMAMGIRREINSFDYKQVQPVIQDVIVMPDLVSLEWPKAKMDGVAVFGSYDGANFDFLGTDLRSPFEDRRPNKVPGQPETRFYKLRYIKNDEQVGQYSDIRSVTVLIG